MTNTSRMTLLLAVAGSLFGGFFAIEEWFFHSSFNTNDSMIWTLPLITYIFLALMSTGPPSCSRWLKYWMMNG